MSKFKALTTRQKIGYIRDYYSIHIIAAAVVIAIISWGLNHYIFNPPPRTFINISFYGRFVPEDLRMTLAENLTNSLVEEGENYAVMIENFFSSGDIQFDMAMSQRMLALMTAREIDVLIITPGAEDGFMEAGFALDLREFIAADEEILSLSMIYFPDFQDLVRQFEEDFDDWTLIVMSNSERYDAVRTFLNYSLLLY